jgi:ABC-type multidrug transport system, ATPase component
MENYIIETNGLCKRFGQFTAVDGIDLKVPEGAVFGFLGPNGAGKSTTIRMILGLIKPTEGEVKVFGKSMEDSRLDILKATGSLVEYPSYYGSLTAYENLDITREILGAEKKDIERVLEISGLTENKNKMVKKFSLGMKQRLGIANALLGNPRLLILDEPTNGLDPAGIHEIRDLIKSMPEKYGITVMVSSHILNEIELMAGYVGIIDKGKLLFQGTLDDLKMKSSSRIRIEAEPEESVVGYLRKKGCKVDIEDGAVFINLDGLNPAAVNRELVLKGFEVSHISVDHDTLEDIFLNITGEENIA